MWALTLLLFLLTCVYTHIHFKKVSRHYDDLHYDIDWLSHRVDKLEVSEKEKNESESV